MQGAGQHATGGGGVLIYQYHQFSFFKEAWAFAAVFRFFGVAALCVHDEFILIEKSSAMSMAFTEDAATIVAEIEHQFLQPFLLKVFHSGHELFVSGAGEIIHMLI